MWPRPAQGWPLRKAFTQTRPRYPSHATSGPPTHRSRRAIQIQLTASRARILNTVAVNIFGSRRSYQGAMTLSSESQLLSLCADLHPLVTSYTIRNLFKVRSLRKTGCGGFIDQGPNPLPWVPDHRRPNTVTTYPARCPFLVTFFYNWTAHEHGAHG